VCCFTTATSGILHWRVALDAVGAQAKGNFQFIQGCHSGNFDNKMQKKQQYSKARAINFAKSGYIQTLGEDSSGEMSRCIRMLYLVFRFLAVLFFFAVSL
jgi:hypothetical protein